MPAFEKLRAILERAETIFDATLYGKMLETAILTTEKWSRDHDTLHFTSKMAQLYKILFQKNQNEKIAEANAKLQVHESARLAYIDSLTQCYNRRYFNDQQQAFCIQILSRIRYRPFQTSQRHIWAHVWRSSNTKHCSKAKNSV